MSQLIPSLERLAKAVREVSPLSAFSRFRTGQSPFLLKGRGFRVDGFGLDEVFTWRMEPLLDFLFEDYFRVEMTGLENLPAKDAGLIVANHAGLLPFDALMLAYGVRKRHPEHRPVRCLLEDFTMQAPFLAPFLTRMGMVRAHRENAARLLSTGHLLAIFPEGEKAAIKPYAQRYQLYRFGRGGFVRLAYEADVPLIPCVIVGSEEIYPVIDNMQWLRNRLGIPAPPITLTFPLLGLLGLLPLPSKWSIRFGEPMDVSAHISGERDDVGVHKLKEEVRTRLQWMIHDQLSRRESVWMG